MHEHVEVIELDPNVDEFDARVPGYEHEWWSDLAWATRAHGKFLLAVVGREEVARAVLLEHQIQVAMAASDPLLPTLEISRLEVRADHRCRGVGRSAVQALRGMWPRHQFVVFSDQDEFWRRAGLVEHPRIGGSGHEPTIFVADPLSPA